MATGESVYMEISTCCKPGELVGFLGGSVVKNLPAIRETQVQSLSWEDPLEKGMATHSSILAWRIPRAEEPGGLQSTELQRLGHDLINISCQVFVNLP